MKRVAFFDIDGTLWDREKYIPKSAKDSICLLKEKGILTFLCSGRTKAFITDPALLDMGFDGIVAGCGTDVEYQEKAIFYHVIPDEIVKKTIEIFRKYKHPFVFEGRHELFVTNADFPGAEGKAYLAKLREHLGKDLIENEGFTGHRELSKFSSPMGPKFDQDLLDELSPWYYFMIHGNDLAGGASSQYLVEGVPIGISKATGIQEVCKALDISHENTYAFGDSANDVDMLKYVAHGICMGNGSEEAKAAADFVTKDLKDGGIQYGLQHFGLI